MIQACRKQKRKAQQKLFDAYSPKMNGVLMRYLRSKEDREDVLIEAFFKVFDNLDKFRGDGSFEGWIRRIVVNEALMFLRKQSLSPIRQGVLHYFWMSCLMERMGLLVSERTGIDRLGFRSFPVV